MLLRYSYYVYAMPSSDCLQKSQAIHPIAHHLIRHIAEHKSNSMYGISFTVFHVAVCFVSSTLTFIDVSIPNHFATFCVHSTQFQDNDKKTEKEFVNTSLCFQMKHLTSIAKKKREKREKRSRKKKQIAWRNNSTTNRNVTDKRMREGIREKKTKNWNNTKI